MKKPENIAEKVLYLFLIYSIGVFLGCLFYLLRLIGTVRILHKERIPHNHGDQGLLVICNHPSLLEVILVPLLFFWDYILRPFHGAPISTPDKRNYLDKWYWVFWLKFCAITIDRTNRNQKREAFFEMENALKSGRTLVIPPEGTRTCFATKFLYSQKGNKIGILKPGIGLLISKTNPVVLLIWVKDAEKVLPNSPDRKKLYHTFPRLNKQMTIKIGKPIGFRKGLDPEEIVQEVAAMLLGLADEEE